MAVPTTYFSSSQNKEVKIKDMNSFHLMSALCKTVADGGETELISALKQEVVERLEGYEALKLQIKD